ncbi:MAG: ParA family protein [Hyphomicrobiaceae bacterium]
MRNAVAVMNTKGGVGKSTLVLALAETLASHNRKNVLVIDSDAQASVSAMLMTVSNLHHLQASGLSIVEMLIGTVLNGGPLEWPKYVVRGVSDIDDARSIYLLPSDMQLTLLEREVSSQSGHVKLRAVIAELLEKVRPLFDVVLIDCPPGLSVLTESWLREADFHVSPTRADYISTCGLDVFRRFRAMNPEMGFAENLGIIINMFDQNSNSDRQYLEWLREQQDYRCFSTALPRSMALQDAARFVPGDRSYSAKYPGDIGKALRALANEFLDRLAEAEARMPVRPVMRADSAQAR